MCKGNILIPVMTVILAIIAFGAVAWLALSNKKNITTTVNVATIKNVNLTPLNNVDRAINENTNTTVAANYESPSGPFEVSKSNIVAIATRGASETLITHFKKINVTTGVAVTDAPFRISDIHLGLGDQIAAQPTGFSFGSDGDSIALMSSNTYGTSPFTGIYRTSFTTPEKVETLLQYDLKHLRNGDIPRIQGLVYDAQSNSAAFIFPGDEGKNNNTVAILDVATRTVRELKSYTTTPTIVRFLSGGDTLEVYWVDRKTNTNTPQGVGHVEVLDTTSGDVTSTLTVFKDTELTGRSTIYLGSNAIAPNNKVVGFSYSENGTNEIIFRLTATGAITKVVATNGYWSFGAWAPDSGKAFLTNPDGGKVYDLAKGITATVPEVSNVLLWAPGPAVLYQNTDNAFMSYNPTSAKSTKILDAGGIYSYGYEGGGSPSIAWVNR